MSKPFYITTTLPYVNADPHIGFAFELISADIVARHRQLAGDEVFFNTGTDEHGTKVWEKAKEAGKGTQAYTDEYAEKFKELREPLGLLPTINFIRTTDPHHVAAAQEFWKCCLASGDIYKKHYRVRYCVGCELEKTDSELVDGRCGVHPNQELQTREEENYFFRLSKYQDALLALYDANPDFVVPRFRLNEIRSLIQEKGLEDFSISRLKTKMPWGVPVPSDADHVMYVWFDALVNYISAIGWPRKANPNSPRGEPDDSSFRKWWIESGGVVQFAGKDQVRQQSVMWQAMLMSAKLPPSRQIVIHGFITSGGEKMSKSLGNVIDPLELVREYGTDALRFYLARHVHPFEDSDFTLEKFKEAYNADLANGIGNLTSRIMKMAETNLEQPVEVGGKFYPTLDYSREFESFDIQKAATIISTYITGIDQIIQTHQPFKLVKEDKVGGLKLIADLVKMLYIVADKVQVFMPKTSEKIKGLIMANKMPSVPLFPRK
ncbi:MAG: Methionine-tRNA ligase [Parcubacteria group bacterium GW2011_GWA2_49_9]|nr:MAG: Methionine-tRNA ligase [Parcubacteria group bacterium GW2011_GWA2_49_9]